MPPDSTTPARASVAPFLGRPAFCDARAVRRLAGVLLGPVALLATWQLVVGLAPGTAVVSPSDVARAATAAWERGDLPAALTTSVARGVVGFALAVAIGTPVALAVARVRWFRTAFGPLLKGLLVLPAVAWVPAAVLWFGLTDATVYFVVLMGSVPSVVNGLVAGMDQVPPLYRRVGAVLGAGPLALTRHVILPAALPAYVAGLRQGWAFSWRSLMGAELIAGGGHLGVGLGALLQEGRALGDLAAVLVAMLLILTVGVLAELLAFAPLESRLARRRGLAPQAAR